MAFQETPSKYILFFCVACFFFWATQYLYTPILPVYSQSVGADLTMVGLIVASYSVPQLFLRIPVGILFDSLKRRKPLLISGVLLASIGALGLGLARDPWTVFWARAITGVASATWVSFIIYFLAYHGPRDSGRALSILNFVLLAAMVAATLSGGLLAQAAGYQPTFFGAAALGIVAFIAVLLTREPTIARGRRLTLETMKHIVASRPLLMASLLGFLSTFADWCGLFSFVPIYGARIGASSADLGIITTTSLAASAIASLVLARLVKRTTNTVIVLISAILSGASLLAIPWVSQVPVLVAVMIVNGLGRGPLMIVFMSMCIHDAPVEERATTMGIFQSLYALGMAGGPWVSGLIAKAFGLAPVFYMAGAVALVVGALAFLPAIRHLDVREGA